ncbi:unnamed protein product [Paramecium sonneborni]|uniref:PARG catalytic Macro domain-containing protein n=1 Tax=Paramecium sonneborni TaxID=65129 RepID=A0A8S1PSH5_9CILI|nr:unnamed protein product [Paramecium sonneborni]
MKMNKEINQFKCYLNEANYNKFVDDIVLDRISREAIGIKNYIKNSILNDKKILEQLLLKVYDDWEKQQQVELKRKQIFTLIILMLLNLVKRNEMFGGFYTINMEHLKKSQDRLCQQKLYCIENYIKLFYQNKDKLVKSSFSSDEQVQFQDQIVRFIKNQVNSDEYKKKFDSFKKDDQISQLAIQIDITQKKNEDQDNSTVVDFADQNIGGLALNCHNCAQEEILMLIFPEAITSMIFIPPMKNNEAVLITNLKKYSSYTGYENSFKQKIQEDLNSFFNMIAIDAQPFNGNKVQFQQENLQRELLKCYSGFCLALKCSPENEISTGRWGCGIFGGNQYLKIIIQMSCFAQANYEEINRSQQTKNKKLIINCNDNQDLFEFGSGLKTLDKKLNLRNLQHLMKQLQTFNYQNDQQLKNFIFDVLKQQDDSIQQIQLNDNYQNQLKVKQENPQIVQHQQQLQTDQKGQQILIKEIKKEDQKQKKQQKYH